MKTSSPRPNPSLTDVRRALAEKSLSQFIRQAWPYTDPAAYEHNWHIDAICEHLEAVSRGQIRRLIINIPPRHMKSISVSVAWPAWSWCQKPTPGTLLGAQTSWLFVSYAHALSIRDNVKCRRLMASPWYQRNWGDRFELTVDQNTKIRFDNDQQGYRIATSVDGQLTGEGGDIIVVDDPHNVREAESETVRDSVITWWDEAMQTRLNDPRTGAYVIIMQRVHERDLTGHILAKNHNYTHLCLPARFESDHPHLSIRDERTVEGELLWPKRIGKEELEELETSLGSYGTAGQLQQRPAPRGGGLFQKDWFEVVNAVPAGGTTVRAWDLAATDAAAGKDPDWTAGCKMTRAPNGFYYIEDMVRFRGSPETVETTVKNTATQDGPNITLTLPQDPGQAGKSQARYLVRQLPGFNARIRLPTGSKVVRATPLASQAEAGNVKLVRGPWNNAFLEESAMFPSGAHDDQIDAAADAFNEIVLGTTPVAQTGYYRVAR